MQREIWSEVHTKEIQSELILHQKQDRERGWKKEKIFQYKAESKSRRQNKIKCSSETRPDVKGTIHYKDNSSSAACCRQETI